MIKLRMNRVVETARKSWRRDTFVKKTKPYLSLLFIVLLPFLLSSTPTDSSLNIVLILADDMQYGHMHCAGDPTVKTPHLDQLARQGVRFSHCISPNPICSPSRACILTGQDTWTNGCTFFGEGMDSSSVLFPQVLKEAGYETFYTGKWHNDGKPSTRGFTSGNAIFIGGMNAVKHGGQASPIVRDYGGNQARQVDTFSTELFAEAAIRFIQKPKHEKPFLLFVSFTVPHDPWMPPGKYDHMYNEEDIPLPINYMPTPMSGKVPFAFFNEWHGTHLRDEQQMDYPRTPQAIRDVRRRYFGTITHMDEQIGRIMAALQKEGLAENTLVIFLADHGICLGAHGISGKQNMYEEAIRLPLILYHPHLPKGEEVNSALTSLIDISPTILDAVGKKVLPSTEGKSLLPLYTGKVKKIRDQTFSTFVSPARHRLNSRCIRTTSFKLIQHLETGEMELYNLKEDPYELANLYDDPSFANIKTHLLNELLKWRKTGNHPDK